MKAGVRLYFLSPSLNSFRTGKLNLNSDISNITDGYTAVQSETVEGSKANLLHIVRVQYFECLILSFYKS